MDTVLFFLAGIMLKNWTAFWLGFICAVVFCLLVFFIALSWYSKFLKK